MTHLTPQELIDLAESGLTRERASHLNACAACRQQAEELQAVWRLAREVQVPEPSPLFWDHFSARVRTAIAAEPPGGGGLQTWSNWSRRARWVTSLTFAGAIGAVVLALVVWRSGPVAPGPPAGGTTPRVASLPVGEIEHAAEPEPWPDDDPSLRLVADLTRSLDWEEVHEAGLTVSTGSAEHAVWHLSDAERRELARLLKAEIGRPRS